MCKKTWRDNYLVTMARTKTSKSKCEFDFDSENIVIYL